MSPTVKNAIAALIISATAVIWIPRLTGWDPLHMYATASTPNAAGIAVAPLDYGDDWLAQQESAAAPEQLTGAAAPSLASLGAVLGFLEDRSVQREASANAALAARAVGDATGGATTAKRELDLFLAQNPLLALAVGSRRSSALFGRTQVAVGDRMAGGTILVHAIERDGVLLDTPTGRVQVPLVRASSISPSTQRTAVQGSN